MRKVFVAALSAAMGCLLAANAGAATYVGTVSGVISFGIDRDGVFGTPEAVLTGDSFVETFTYDSSTAVNFFDAAQPIFVVYGALALTVNGVTITGLGEDNSAFNTLGVRAVSGGNPDPYLPFVSADPSMPFWLQPSTDLVILSTPDGSRGALRLNVTSRSISPTPSAADFNFTPVPEPASWALLVSGFFGLGQALRSRRQRQPVRAAT